MEGRLLTAPSECLKRVNKVIDRIAELLQQALNEGSSTTLTDVLDEASKLISEGKSKPCISVKSVSHYYTFLYEHLDVLSRAIFNRSMEATAKHLERLGFNVYALISVTIVGYALNLLQLISIARNTIPLLDPTQLALLESVVFASALRFMAFCRLIEKLSSRDVRRYAGRIIAMVEQFNREDANVLKKLLGEVSAQLRGREAGQEAG
jgi:hypothetical protein